MSIFYLVEQYSAQIYVYCSRPILAYVLQIVIIANHMNGKDTHVRGLHVLGPIEWVFNGVLIRAYSLMTL